MKLFNKFKSKNKANDEINTSNGNVYFQEIEKYAVEIGIKELVICIRML